MPWCLVVVKVLMQRRRAAPGAGLLSASLAHAPLVLGDEGSGGGREQGEEAEGCHDGTAVREERKGARKKGKEH